MNEGVVSSVEGETGRSSLHGRTALVTGAAKRIGRSIALALGEAGADVCLSFRDSEQEAVEVVGELEALGVRAFALRSDLTDPAQVRVLIGKAVGLLGRLDIVVNNAGAFASEAMEQIDVEAWDRMFAINTRAPFLVAQAALSQLRANRGRIINIGSLGGVHPWATHAHYCTSKAALHMLSQTMAKAWAPEVSVNCVAPGMIVEGEVDPMYERFARNTPMQRNGTAGDVAQAVLFFATGPHFVTGQTLVVDGGLGL